MDKILEQTLLFDFYGELLTEHQKEIYEDVILNDYSYTEIAEEKGISRQGVHDLIKRCTKTLAEYEEKLQLVDRFIRIRTQIEAMEKDLKESDCLNRDEVIERLEEILQEL